MITDIDLIRNFGRSVCDDYEIAVEFITVNPDFSLMKFRKVLEHLCVVVAKKNSVKFDSSILNKQISTLFECNYISSGLKDFLHEARKLCNTGVHKPLPAENENEAAFQAKLHDDLIGKAKNARSLVLKIVEECYRVIKPGAVFPDFVLTEEGTQEQRTLLLDGISSLCAKKKYKAGLLCESIADKMRLGAPLIVSEETSYHLTSLYRTAANLYEASYKISANVDSRSLYEKVTGGLSLDEFICQYCDTESLFRFARLACDGVLGDESIERGKFLLKTAADRGHAEACADYGAFVYDDGEDYSEAIKYLKQAADLGEQASFVYLWHFYTDGKACKVDYPLAFKWLNCGVNLDYPDALTCLGISYHKGIYFQKDDEKAEIILKDAMEKGSQYAYRYYMVEFHDLAGALASKFKEYAEAIKTIGNELKPVPLKRDQAKVGPNQLCPCGSNKKYKKCCRDKLHNEKLTLLPPHKLN